MAIPTLANSPNPLQLFTHTVRLFPSPNHAKSQPEFLVFSTGQAEHSWRIVALGTGRTISRHKSLSFALKKCTRLNQQRSEGASNEIN